VFKLILQRSWVDNRVTLGALKVVGVNHEPIFTLENPQRATTNDSKIPPGSYMVAPYSSAKFPKAWELKNVAGRTAILVHAGNTEAETTGCILVGLSSGPGLRVNQSRDAMKLLETLLGNSNFILEIKEVI
jgi:hypothetical protein